MKLDSDVYKSKILLEGVSSPQTMQWENSFVTPTYRRIAAFIFILCVIVYMVVIYFVMTQARFLLESIRYDYAFSDECAAIDNYFQVFEETQYRYYASIDKDFVRGGQSTGVYQCYCQERIGFTNFWRIWTNLSICDLYVRDGFGGQKITLPLGILNAVLVNVGVFLVVKYIPLLRFRSIHVRQHVTVLVIFIFSYLSFGVLILKRYWSDSAHYLPPDFT